MVRKRVPLLYCTGATQESSIYLEHVRAYRLRASTKVPGDSVPSQTPERFLKVDPLMGVPVKYP